jgi:hypothetical protein
LDFFYQANYNNLENGAVYSVVEDVNKDKTLNVISHFDTKFKDNWKFNANFSYQNLKSDNFRRVKDLLGANYANNLDAFGNDLPYDIDAADTKVYEGDRTQYSYILNKNTYAINLSTEIDLPRWNVVASIFSSHSESYRDGQFRNHYYAGNHLKEKAMFIILQMLV